MWVYIVRCIHLLFILYIIIVPFTNNKYLLKTYTYIIPFLFYHWLLNDDTCFLTVIEKRLTGKKKNDETFIGSIISPIYKMESNRLNNIIKSICIILWLIVINKK